MQKSEYTGYIKINLDADAVAMDIPTMRELNRQQYVGYLDELFFVDHHDVVRTNFGEYPIAVTKEQIDALIEYLNKAKARIAD